MLVKSIIILCGEIHKNLALSEKKLFICPYGFLQVIVSLCTIYSALLNTLNFKYALLNLWTLKKPN